MLPLRRWEAGRGCSLKAVASCRSNFFAKDHSGDRRRHRSPGGTVYVNTRSGVYYKNDVPPPGGFLVAGKDTKGAPWPFLGY